MNNIGKYLVEHFHINSVNINTIFHFIYTDEIIMFLLADHYNNALNYDTHKHLHFSL